MRTFCIILILCFFVSNVSIGQNTERKLNLIIVIDQKVIVGGLLNIQFRSGNQTFPVSYEPGNLTMLDTSKVFLKLIHCL